MMHWGSPDFQTTIALFQEVSNSFCISMEEVELMHESGGLHLLLDDAWAHYQNTDSWNITSLHHAKEYAQTLGQKASDVDRIVERLDGMMGGSPVVLDAPMVLYFMNGSTRQPRLISGDLVLATMRGMLVEGVMRERPTVYVIHMW